MSVEGNQSRTIRLLGSDWPQTSLDLDLAAGVNLVGYPAREVPSSVATASGLLRFARNASFLVRLAAQEDGRSRFEVHLPGLSPDFAIEPGRAYILVNRIAETVVLP